MLHRAHRFRADFGRICIR